MQVNQRPSLRTHRRKVSALSTALRPGTRGSPLALAQANLVAGLLADRGVARRAVIEIVVITTADDLIQDRALADVGRNGLFTKEIDEAQLDRRIDLAVHSGKDLPTQLPPGLMLAARYGETCGIALKTKLSDAVRRSS